MRRERPPSDDASAPTDGPSRPSPSGGTGGPPPAAPDNHHPDSAVENETRWFRTRPGKILLLAALGAYLVFYGLCLFSTLPGHSELFTDGDMHANLRWAESIRAQGWINPAPHHPYNRWMHPVAPMETWERWWGTAAIFQQSPLYAYLLAAAMALTGDDLAQVHLFHVLGGFVLCVLVGELGARFAQRERAGLWAFAMAAAYAPFYVYAWPLLRDTLGWVLTAAVLLAWLAWDRAWNAQGGRPGPGLSIGTGVLLAAGWMARETLMPFAVLFAGAAWVRAFRNGAGKTGAWKPAAALTLALVLGLAPLVVRNARAGAPWLSTSNRFAENFIEFNAPNASVLFFTTPPELGVIMEQSDGRASAVVRHTLALYQGQWGQWIRLLMRRALSLFDPHEAGDNVNPYYFEDIAPMVRFGLKHWMLIVPGVCGLGWSLLRRERGHAWLWVFMGAMLGGLVLFGATSRYRTGLMVLWIPWAAYAAQCWWNAGARARGISLAAAALMWTGMAWWAPSYPPLMRWRALEYKYEAQIHDRSGRPDRAWETMARYCRRVGKPLPKRPGEGVAPGNGSSSDAGP